jgi:muconolactone delta-isomerase
MKFLVESEIYPDASIERLADALERTKAQVARSDSGVEVECVYGVAGRRGAIAICNAPDAESLHRLLVSAPLFHFERFTITPLVSFEASLTAMSEAAAAILAEETKT